MTHIKSALFYISAGIIIANHALAANSGDFSGPVAIGTAYAGIANAPTNGLIVQGNTGIGTNSPSYTLDIRGSSGPNISSNNLPVINKIDTQIFTSSGTYTPCTGLQYADVEAVGAGGGSGGSASTTATQIAQGGGGGGGGYTRKLFPAATIGTSQPVTVGSGGSAGSAGANAGGAGGASTFGSLLMANGGGGGTGGLAATVTAGTFTAGGNGGSASGGSINIPGGFGGQVILPPILGYAIGGAGGASFMATPVSGSAGTGAGPGTTGNVYGGGAGGAASNQSAAAQAGAVGGAGGVFITEYCSQ
jgi:hypothetical protein